MPPSKAEPKVERPEEPELVVVGMTRVKGGHVAFTATIQGNKVMQRKIHGPPQPKEFTAATLKMLVLRFLVYPEMKVCNLDEHDWRKP
jgi:hypothetical protein